MPLFNPLPLNSPVAATDTYLQPVNNAVAANFPRYRITNNIGTAPSGTVVLAAIGMQQGQVASSLTMMVGNTAKGGASHAWFVLADQNRVVQAVSADQTDAATFCGTAATFATLPFTASYTATYSGLYYAGNMVAASTTPSFNGQSGMQTNVAGTASGAAMTVAGTSSTGQTTPPAIGSTLATISSVAADVYFVELT